MRFDFPQATKNKLKIEGGASHNTLFGDIGKHFTSEIAIDSVRDYVPSNTLDIYHIRFVLDKDGQTIQTVIIEK